MAGISWWVPLVAALIGGFLATGSSIALEAYRRSVERKSLALAFRGELLAITRIVATRKYVEYLEAAIETLANGQTVHMPPVRIERDYFPVYTENASKIGILPPALAESLARAYVFSNSFIEDATMPRQPVTTPAALEGVAQTLEVLRLALNEAHCAVQLIDAEFINKNDKWWNKTQRRDADLPAK